MGDWLGRCAWARILPREIGVFVRAEGQIARAVGAVRQARLPYRILADRVVSEQGRVAIGTMHLAKGLEFCALVVMACDDEIIPPQACIETVGDDADLQKFYDTEPRLLLYVACTRIGCW